MGAMVYDADESILELRAVQPRPLATRVIILQSSLNASRARTSSIFRNINTTSTHIIISDDNVSSLYMTELQSLLELHRINAVIISITPGEQSKSISMYLNLLNQAIDAGTDRSSTVISLGGGVVKDLPGIVAATLYRGVDLIHIPTTLLAQLDGTIDFNQAVNMPQGKNLVGTYYVASVVWINTIFLQTLDDRRVRDGLCESVKHAICHSSSLFERQLPFLYPV